MKRAQGWGGTGSCGRQSARVLQRQVVDRREPALPASSRPSLGVRLDADVRRRGGMPRAYQRLRPTACRVSGWY
jgi:hypothetical protein